MSKTSSKPLVFLSYAPFDESHERGRLSSLVELLGLEVKSQHGDEFTVFMDRSDMKPGEWGDKIESALAQATVLVAILTPNYFKSRFCRRETKEFLEREKLLGRHDLIIPVYYLGDEKRLSRDELGEAIAGRPHFDWTELRFEPLTSKRLRREMARVAKRIGEVVKQVKTTS